MTPYGLMTEQRHEPLDLGEPRTRVSWKQESARLACGWSLADCRITVTATVPPGSTALLEIPTTDPDSVHEDGARVADRPGVLGVVPAADGVTLRLASGRYTVSAAAPGAWSWTNPMGETP